MRVLDFFVSLLSLAILSPLFLVITVLIKIDSSGPVFHRSRRVGKKERLFNLYKFRTMVVNAEKFGPGITAKGDMRTTQIGKLLRSTKADELPQLFNVLKGEMSLVGPRPEDPRYVAIYTIEQRQILNFRPGITSAASLAYRQEEEMLSGVDWEKTYRTLVLPDKLAIDLDYLSKRSFLSDLFLIWRTILSIFDYYQQ